MKKSNLKIKYLIGTYLDDPDYPTKEDFISIADQWYHFDGGHYFMHDNRGLPDDGCTLFTNNLIKEKNLPKKAYDILSSMIECGEVEIIKETKHTIYHKINKK